MKRGTRTVSRCFIVQDLGRIDFLPAEQYGELVFVVVGRTSIHHLNRTVEAMRNKMRDITKDDWIIACGNPVLIALAGAIMAQRTGCVRVLSWDAQVQRYIPAEVAAS